MNFTEDEIKEFVTEAQELLDAAEKDLLAIDQSGEFDTHYAAIFRTYHSVKGAAGMMEMTRLQQHMHQLETIFTEQKNKKSISKPLLDFFLKGTDAAREILLGKEVQFDYSLKDGIPSQPSSATSIPKIEPSKNNESSLGKVIAVDDEESIIALIAEHLRFVGIEVIATSDPSTVMQLIETHQPDALLSDIRMPEIDGPKLLSMVSKKHPDLPVIFISGYVEKDILVRAIEDGIYAVIEKPFRAAQLTTTCINAIRKHKLTRLLNSSVNLLLYQFSDLDAFLKTQGKDDVRGVIQKEINTILEQKRLIREVHKQKKTQ